MLVQFEANICSISGVSATRLSKDCEKRDLRKLAYLIAVGTIPTVVGAVVGILHPVAGAVVGLLSLFGLRLPWWKTHHHED
jgi:Mn2+/Fe2+ NRAMP family transporter